ncbi:MAG: glycosyltransferase [Desulfobacteraceae bacterium]|nr:MAG: glycosyltransferase [Desulfobacteraceae bacterium]
MNIVFIGLSITSSWGNGHASTYRGLIASLARRGHCITYLERDTPWYAANRDLTVAGYCRIDLYTTLPELRRRHETLVRDADLVVVGSYVPEGIAVGQWAVETAGGLTAFYDIDTPVTMADLEKARCSYLSADLISRFDVYLSFTGGPFLSAIQKKYNVKNVVALYCSADPALYYPTGAPSRYDMGYMGTYSPDRQPGLDRLLIRAARNWAQGRFVIAGPQYPESLNWPDNLTRVDHIAPENHRDFYNAQRYTLNLTRADMIRSGYSPSVRLFEAAACATPIISDYWPGLETFFVPGEEILVSRSAAETLHYLRDLNETRRRSLGEKARRRLLSAHTPDHRAAELDNVVTALLQHRPFASDAAPQAERSTYAGKTL